MRSFQRVTLAVAAKICVAVSGPAMADTHDIPAPLIEELHLWIDAASDLPRAPKAAKIVFVDPDAVTEPSKMASVIGNVPRGLYAPSTGEITLVRPWSARDPQDISVLLHELVHHRQNGKHYYCEAAKEHTAYMLQSEWLSEWGLVLDVNWVAVILASSCTPRDIHPEAVDGHPK